MRLGRAQFHQIARLRNAVLAAGHDERTMLTIARSVEDDSADLTRTQWNVRVQRVTARIIAGEQPDIESGIFFGFKTQAGVAR